MKMEKLASKLFGERLNETFDFGERKVVLQTLTKNEQVEILKRFTSGVDYLTQSEAIKVPILAKSIVEIDGTPWDMFDEIRPRLQKDKNAKVEELVEEELGKLPVGVIEVLYGFYLQLMEKDRIRTDELKNSSKGLTQD